MMIMQYVCESYVRVYPKGKQETPSTKPGFWKNNAHSPERTFCTARLSIKNGLMASSWICLKPNHPES